MEYYIRIGELPLNGKSKVYQWNDKEHSSRTAIRDELGVSVYESRKEQGIWKIILPDSISQSTIDTAKSLIDEVRNGKKRVYVVTGDRVGAGYDGEPVLTNVKIIEDISEDMKRRALKE